MWCTCIHARASASGVNLVQDPSFEQQSPRGLDPHDRPWVVKKRDRPPVPRSCRARLPDGKQFARMQYVSGTGSEVPAATSRFCFTNRCNSQHGLYISYWIRGTTNVSSAIQIPFLDDCQNYRRLPATRRELTFALTTMATRRSDLGPTRRIMTKSMSAKI